VHGVPSPTRHLPLDRAEANIVFQLVSRRYERGAMIVTSNKASPSGASPR
jgi:hypothetical protein